MCGIFGWLPGPEYRKYDLAQVGDNLAEALKRRGPDDRGFAVFSGSELVGDERNRAGLGLSAGSFLMGHTRLSIIDLSPAGRQPMFSPDGRYCLVYNGEIYNYLELRRELSDLGEHFSTDTDSEVLLRAFIRWGRGALDRFSGMFAFAVYDRKKNTLFCACDHFAVKPFYYSAGPGGRFAFASDLPAIMQIPGLPRRLDWQTAVDYLNHWKSDVGERSMIEGVKRLPPGHCLEVDLNAPEKASAERYWAIPLADTPLKISFQDAAAEVRRLFLESVALHLRSDVPWSVALSGGLDSSSILFAVRHLLPSAHIRTFSYIADGARINEEKWVDLAAGEARAEARKIRVGDNREILDDLDALIRAQGEPFLSTSIYAQYRVFKLVGEHQVPVTLDGQGADEFFGGYIGFPEARVRSLAGRGHLRRAFGIMARELPSAGQPFPALRQLGRLLKISAEEALPGFFSSKPAPIPWPAWLNQAEAKARLAALPVDTDELPYQSPYRLREALANRTWLRLPNLLRHADRNSMAFSIESRVPFCYRPLVEFSLNLPEEYLVTDQGLTKAVLRQAMQDLVPQAIVDRSDKVGFETPEKEWFLGVAPDKVENILNGAASSVLLDHRHLLEEWRGIRSGTQVFGHRLWRWINYLRWKEIFNVEE